MEPDRRPIPTLLRTARFAGGNKIAIWNAVTTIITPTPWRAEDAIRVMAEERVTVAQGVPTQWALMLASAALPSADLSALRVAGTGAARDLVQNGIDQTWL